MANTLDELKQFIADKKQGINKTVKGAVATALTLGVLGTATACGNTPVSTTPSTPADTVATVATTDTTATTPVETTATTAEETTATTSSTTPVVIQPIDITNYEEIENFDDVPEITPESKDLLQRYIEENMSTGLIVDENIFKGNITFGVVHRIYNGEKQSSGYLEFDYNFAPAGNEPINYTSYFCSYNPIIFQKYVELFNESIGDKLEIVNEDNIIINTEKLTPSEINKLYQIIHSISYTNNKYKLFIDNTLNLNNNIEIIQ